jgi:hypothetical protein
MPCYPWPVIIAIAGWTFIFVMNGWQYMVSAIVLVIIGVIAWCVFTAPARVSAEKAR